MVLQFQDGSECVLATAQRAAQSADAQLADQRHSRAPAMHMIVRIRARFCCTRVRAAVLFVVIAMSWQLSRPTSSIVFRPSMRFFFSIFRFPGGRAERPHRSLGPLRRSSASNSASKLDSGTVRTRTLAPFAKYTRCSRQKTLKIVV